MWVYWGAENGSEGLLPGSGSRGIAGVMVGGDAVTLLNVCTYVSDALIILAAVIALLTGVGVLGGWISWHCRDQERRGPTS